MTWRKGPRPSFTHVSTHQTHVGKALYEHAPDCATIAAVACMSSSLLKSSLGPNLLALICVEDDTFDLFDKIFLEFNPHMQLTQKLFVNSFEDHDKAATFISKLKSNGPLLSSSLLQAAIHLKCLWSLDNFRALRTLTLTRMFEGGQLTSLKSLPSLSELTLYDCHNFDAAFFDALGDLEINRNLRSLRVPTFFQISSWSSESFQKDFCGRLLSKNRLTKLELPSYFLKSMNENDEEAIVNAGMTNLVELIGVPPKLIRGEGFRNLRILCVGDATDEHLVNVGNHCLLLEVLKVTSDCLTGSFLKDENLVREAFKLLRELTFHQSKFLDAGFGVQTWVNFDGSCLQHLPNPERLRSLNIQNRNLSVCNLHRFVNLEEVELCDVQISRDDILSFVELKQLKRIILHNCGGATACSAHFRILCAQLTSLVELRCYGTEKSRWTEDDVEAILTECNGLRELQFHFRVHCDSDRPSRLAKKFPTVFVHGSFQKNATPEQERGSRREREE